MFLCLPTAYFVFHRELISLAEKKQQNTKEKRITNIFKFQVFSKENSSCVDGGWHNVKKAIAKKIKIKREKKIP